MPTKAIKNPVIGEAECPSCNGTLPLSINRNGCVYVYCTHKDNDGDRCFYRATFGKKKSIQMIKEFSGDLSLEPTATNPETEEIGTENVKFQIEEKHRATSNVRTRDDKSIGILSRLIGAIAE